MGNITDDIREHFGTFAELSFNETDSLALAQLAYARMPDNVPQYQVDPQVAAESVEQSSMLMVSIRDLLRAECYDAMFGKVWSPQMNVDLLRAMCENPRWRNLRVGEYVDEFDPETTKQFSACTFALGDAANTLYVSFRGTDSSIVGWKEDFTMAFRRPVASQESATEYLINVAHRWGGPIMVGGHSKGGNLAVYAAACAPKEIQNRITAVFSHDGPGFDDDFFALPGFKRIESKVCKSVPGSSIIGMLFETREQLSDGYTVVNSDGIGIMQHFALHWQVNHGQFVQAEGLTSSAQYLARTVNGWMARFDDEHRRRFIENLFAIFEASGYKTFGELTSHLSQSLPLMLAAARNIDVEDRDVMIEVVKGFAATAASAMLPIK
ncbi:DUF2974 domain-containing protein [Bifidobacterium imperatoris]|uniref:DUF2974 domain-containing protein n=1 Tax=Bifidobacterium imperatoris TaxID=2020965 RepID=A0A2N5IRQ5_9BIFI|nr:DUF2974 domain-containing protein [Bifidobacterium imperatoris]PLS24638.1 hypothetical protein Tam1G_1226 [Bifidobacterium imperatoris]QSY57430.1 DUF2974 domain-containing protein [Bifidobacterium imperatoris]